jgi:nicotinate-nucleotide--dimethylbenzimidazole phosphoribosyltransferase
MAANIASGGAAVSVLARQAGARVVVVDIGIMGDTGAIEGLLQYKVAPGSQNMRKGPALTGAQVEQAINVGLRVLREQAEQGLDVVALGEMGIGNTTTAAALTAVFTAAPVERVTGRGTGLDDAGLARKMDVIKESICVNRPDADDALDVLSKVGGLDITGLVGIIIGAASLRLPVVVDGFISAAAALAAVKLLPQVRPYLIASHRSLEAGHDVICEYMGFEPLLDLNMRLGEGSGAVLALHLVEAAARILNEMSTFSDAGVSQK